MAKKKPTTHCIGILTSGGDCQGLNAAIRAVAKTAMNSGIDVIGIRDGFRGLIEGRAERLLEGDVSGILTLGGTILGTTRDKPDKIQVGDEIIDLTAKAVANYHKLHLDALVCLGGGGTQKNALKLMRHDDSLRIITLPKTIDNDVAGTDITFGYDTAVQIATEAIDRLHSTASSHQRVMVVEIMGHNTGWLAASAGLAGGADVVLIPEIPYSSEAVARDIIERSRKGKRFSIVAVAEGARSREQADAAEAASTKKAGRDKTKDERGDQVHPPSVGARVAEEIEARTGIQARLTALGHIQRGGTPSSFDRILATNLGTRAAELAVSGAGGVMVAVRGPELVTVPLEEVAGKRKTLPLDHRILQSLRAVGVSLGEG
jgi:6-phosphofructokinase 1